jgi:CYTH domain-containing protein
LHKERGALVEKVAPLVQVLLGFGEQAAKLEIEHKFLLSGLPALPPDSRASDIEQGYLDTGDAPERLRRTLDPDGTIRHHRTVKLGRGVSRTEIEEAIATEEFERLWPRTDGCRVHKRRHRVAAEQGTWEIDEFLDRPLVLAELELSDASEKPEIPDWLAPHVVRDVSCEAEYTNLHLARTGRGVPQELG